MSLSHQAPGPTTSSGVITRLNPSDGLFLRAEHLKVMQDYARDLTLAVGLASGAGVVHGYSCLLASEGGEVHVTGGLAVDPHGRPLRSTSGAELDISKLDPGPDDFYVVEIRARTWTYGSEGVYGALCADPCGNGSTIAPYAVEGVEFELREDEFPGELSKVAPVYRRNRLASLYFERERRNGGLRAPTSNRPWLLPNDDFPSIAPLDGRPWGDGAGAPGGDSVQLAVLQKINGEWVLDPWVARREVADPPPKVAWQWRLGMRPWSVFLAQVLQFQGQLADDGVDVAPQGGLGPELAEEVVKLFGDASKLTKQKIIDRSQELKRRVEDEQASPEGGGALLRAGVAELPPAGYLQVPKGQSGELLRNLVRAEFGDTVTLTFRECRADYVAHAIAEAQHQDRIPLESMDGALPEVEILLPQSDLVDLPALAVDGDYGWVAFVRRRESAPATTVDLVDLVVLVPNDAFDRAKPAKSTQFVAAARKDSFDMRGYDVGFRAELTYPSREWGVPGPGGVIKKLEELHDELGKMWDATIRILAIGLAKTDDRLPLAAVRAGLLCARAGSVSDLDLGDLVMERTEGREVIVLVMYPELDE